MTLSTPLASNGVKMVRKSQEASAPVNLTCPFQPVRPLWDSDECREGVREKGLDGGGRLRHVVQLSLVPRAKLNLHVFCSHIHSVNTKSIVKSCSGT